MVTKQPKEGTSDVALCEAMEILIKNLQDYSEKQKEYTEKNKQTPRERDVGST